MASGDTIVIRQYMESQKENWKSFNDIMNMIFQQRIAQNLKKRIESTKKLL